MDAGMIGFIAVGVAIVGGGVYKLYSSAGSSVEHPSLRVGNLSKDPPQGPGGQTKSSGLTGRPPAA